MKLQKITIEEIANHPSGDYNRSIWVKEVKAFSKFKNIQFYIAIETPNRYDTFFASYVIPEGIHFLNEFGFTSCLTNRPFKSVRILEDGTIEKGNIYYPNDKKNRKLIAGISQVDENIMFTNCI